MRFCDLLNGLENFQYVLALKLVVRIRSQGRISFDLDSKALEEERCCRFAQHQFEFKLCPHVEGTFRLLRLLVASRKRDLGVCVLCGEETPRALIGHFSRDIVQDTAHGRLGQWVAVNLESLKIGKHKLGLIVEHLLKMGNVPEVINRVPVKTPAKMVVHAAECHLSQGVKSHISCAPPNFAPTIPRNLCEEHVEDRWPGKLWPASKAALDRVVHLLC
mmetsp:Transcript_9631/g.29189  ORF Transcript_9631/g.29189 Transcript_9631/m.29189 type:complete len:218 (-) Transcript_9631:866-1519(-)